MIEMIYNETSKDLDEFPVRGVHMAEVCMEHTNEICLALWSWPDTEAPTVDRLASQLKQVEENLSSTPTLQVCILAEERLSQQFQLFKDSIPFSLPIPATISAIE